MGEEGGRWGGAVFGEGAFVRVAEDGHSSSDEAGDMIYVELS